MQLCPNCNHNNRDSARFCAMCQAQLQGLLGAQTILQGRYEIMRVLGCGGMGAVYLAEDTRLGRKPVAIKENFDTSPAAQAQFQREADILARLTHPHLPTVTDHFIETNGRQYLTMTWIEGHSLAERLDQIGGRPLPETEVLAWANQLLEALAYCHSRGVIHRDIKPQNIILTPQGQVVLVDFGLVKLYDPTKPSTSLGLRGLGTPEYAPPEQYDAGSGHTEARSDIYALGATLYHLLTDQAPPPAARRIANPSSLLPPCQFNSNLSPHVEAAILRAMELPLSARFQNVNEMQQALRASTGVMMNAVYPASSGGVTVLPDFGSKAQLGAIKGGGDKKAVMVVVAAVFITAFSIAIVGFAFSWRLLFGSLGSNVPPVTSTSIGLVSATPGNTPTIPGLILSTPGKSIPANTPTLGDPQLAIPIVEIISLEVRPIMLGSLPSTDKALLLVNVRVQNVGNAPFVISTNDFSLRTRDGETLEDTGGTTSPEGLRRLGVLDRFNNLTLTPGGSVPQSLIFEVKPETYNVDLVFEPPAVSPIVLGLGRIEVGRELALALGTPIAEETPVELVLATPTSKPTPTPTRPPFIPAPQVVPKSSLVGTIAYAVFNGTDYDLYFGQADGSGTKFFRAGASQPAFNADGSRIAFHSWQGDSRGLMAMDVSGANGKLISNFIEDQLPTWMANSENVIFLSRRSGGRQSQLYKANSSIEWGEPILLGEGEYPSIGTNAQLVFKGWGTTAFGLRIAEENMRVIQTVTNVDEDTAPALASNRERITFMSRRDGNWEIYAINVDGSDLQRLTNDPAEDGLPAWSPDGNAIAFVSNRGGPWALWAMTPDGNGQRQIFTMQGSPDGLVGMDTFASRGWVEERISWTK